MKNIEQEKKIGTWNWGLKPVSSTEKTKTSSGRKQKGGWLLGIKPGKNSYLINPIGFVVVKKIFT